MSRFVDVNGVHINIDSIKSYYRDTNDRLRIELTDGTEEIATSRQAVYIENQLSGRHHITQVIPATELMYAVYKEDESNSYFATPVYYLALCADGEIYGADLCDGWFECESIEHSNCVGLYYKDQLSRFPGAVESITPKEDTAQ